eukprot:COSAG01_NODE_636_length_14635_cov_18.612617_7_plen_396_part_00
MFDANTRNFYQNQLDTLKSENLYKIEPCLNSAQEAWITINDAQSKHKRFLNLCSNNYLGLANHPELIQASKLALDRWGLGMASVRFICGTQALHLKLEQAIAAFVGCEDALLFSSCFDANAGLFEALLGPDDAIFSDALNHACIIDGIRLCKAQRYRYDHRNMSMLDKQLHQAKSAKIKLIVSDGVFSMDGTQAPLKELLNLAQDHKALLMIDDSHGIGVLGKSGYGSSEVQHVFGKLDLITGTFGKALGGAAGGFAAGHKPLIDMLRQKARPYLFSNSLAPPLVASSLAALKLLKGTAKQLKKLQENCTYFKTGLSAINRPVAETLQAIIPIHCGSAQKAKDLSKHLYDSAILATAFAYPVVPKNKARVRLQLSATLSLKDLDLVVACLSKSDI